MNAEVQQNQVQRKTPPKIGTRTQQDHILNLAEKKQMKQQREGQNYLYSGNLLGIRHEEGNKKQVQIFKANRQEGSKAEDSGGHYQSKPGNKLLLV